MARLKFQLAIGNGLSTSTFPVDDFFINGTTLPHVNVPEVILTKNGIPGTFYHIK